MVTKGYGFSINDIDWSCPADLEPYAKAHKLKIQEKDYLSWLSNQYTLSAVSVAVEHCLAGRKARSKYIEKPIMQQIEEQNEPLSEDKLQRQRELFVAKLEVMKTNFELNHPKDGKIL